MASKNKRLLLWVFMELWNDGKLAVADEIFAPEYVNHDPASPDFGTGPEGVKQSVKLYRNAFPDLQFTAEHMIETEQFVTTRFTVRGTHKGDLRAFQPPIVQSRWMASSSTAFRLGALWKGGQCGMPSG